ncbi:hypothetical protein HRR88_006226 [Exophiala dermatitidis]|nr:hypothetical protein HRR84_004321 [Exophiala dermatitidis]KAJ4620378.1 hypothetical protein HRR88_006226 [Exophiala dermatitidis]KAJ4670098.1 hypothetical protein HRR93_005909 [Exophiala dermatitidis]
MFGGPQEHLSEKEIQEGEKKALVEVQIFTAACIALWFCTCQSVHFTYDVFCSLPHTTQTRTYRFGRNEVLTMSAV